jgi:hypothetical protein
VKKVSIYDRANKGFGEKPFTLQKALDIATYMPTPMKNPFKNFKFL